ncbi:Mediator of rna polymerase ii transcription subunit 21 [Rhynchospora pubera]|uniref:Mediator of RNA polymerase II transcription subunit 21 n=1 Tax=Rhynchospora pubera TaxID=906938 RepID=A0AAV8F4X6_9POAL|nr:Mediator of rna polymerase ii transcription subunit 21 [Rhynchospora pubera]
MEIDLYSWDQRQRGAALGEGQQNLNTSSNSSQSQHILRRRTCPTSSFPRFLLRLSFSLRSQRHHFAFRENPDSTSTLGLTPGEMDIISQLQEQVNTIALLAVNTFGTLQRDAPPVRLSTDYPEPAANSNPTNGDANPNPNPNPSVNPSEEANNVAEQPKAMSAALVQAAKKFDALAAALPLSGEEAQLQRIAELQAENEAIGLELQKQLEAADLEMKQVQELFNHATDNCLNLKKPD